MADLKLEVLFNAVDKLSGPIKTIVGGSKTLSDAFKKTSSELKTLEAQQRKISGFRQLKEQSEKTTQAIQQNKETIIQLKTAMNISAPTEQMVKDLARAEAAQKRLKAVQKSQSTEMTALVRELNQTGLSVDNLTDDESKLKNKIHLTTMEINKQKDSLDQHQKAQKQYEQMQGRMAKASDLARKGLMVAGVGAAAMAIPVKLASDFETDMLGVAKQLNGARDSTGKLTKEFFDMRQEVLNLGHALPVSNNELARMTGAGLKMGVAKQDILGFTKEVVKMGTAFELPYDELAENMGKIANMYKRPIKNISELADTINYLDDNALSSGSDIIDFMQRVGGTASMVKITDKNTAALGSTLLSLGERSETASTAINAVFSKLGAANTQSKPFMAMVKNLGLSTNELEKGMQTNAVGTIFKVMDAIKKMPEIAAKGGTSQIDAVATLFGAEHWDTFSKLLKNRGELEKQLQLANSKDSKGSMDREFMARMETNQAQMEIFKNRVSEVGISIGSILLPPLNTLLGKVGNLVTGFTTWIQQNPALASSLVKIAVGGIAIIGAISALSLGVLGLLGPLAMLKMTFSTLGIGFSALGAIFSPAGLVILGIIAAVAGAAYLIYKNWEPIKGFFVGIWNTVKSAFSGGITGVSALIINWSPIGLFYAAFAKVLSWFGVDLPAKFTGFGAMILTGLKNGILSKIGEVKTALSGAVTGVIEKARNLLGIHSPSRVFMGIGDYTMQGMALGISQNNNLPVKATQQATQNVIGTGTTAKVTPVTPIQAQRGGSFISNDTIQITIKAEHGQPVRETARALRAEMLRLQQEERDARRRFLTDTE